MEKRTPKFEDADNRVELRFTGPEIYHNTKTEFYVTVAVNVLLHSMQPDKGNVYQHSDLLGFFASTLQEPIQVLRYGPDPTIDTKEPVGCLYVKEGKKLGVRVHFFDNPDPNDKVRNGMVTAEFSMCIQVENY